MSDNEYAEFIAQEKPCAKCLSQEMNLCNGMLTKIQDSKIVKLVCGKVKTQQANNTLGERLKQSLIPDKFISSDVPTKEYTDKYYTNIDINETPDVIAWVVHQMKTTGATGVVLTKPWLDRMGITYVDTPLINRLIIYDLVVVIYPSKFMTKKHLAMISTRQNGILGRQIQTFIIGE